MKLYHGSNQVVENPQIIVSPRGLWLSGSAAFSLFKESGLLDYIEEFYDVLHSNGTEYLICDIDDYLESNKRN